MGMIESLPVGAAVVHLGTDSLVSPWPVLRLTSTQLAKLEAAALFPAHRPRLLREVEAEMAKEAKRRRLTPPEGRTVRLAAPDASGLLIGESAIYTTDEGVRPERIVVTVMSERGYELEGERPTRRVRAPDGDLIVLERELEPMRQDWSDYEGAQALLPASALGLDCVEGPAGRVYSPAPYRSLERSSSPVMDKFERIQPVELEPVQLRPDRLTERQQSLLISAERMAASRSRQDRVKAREIVEGLQAELMDRQIANEVERRRIETIALELGRGGEFVQEGNRLRRTDRDGLENLLASGAIKAPEYVGGVRYRKLFILTERSVGSAMNFDRTGPRDDNRKTEEWGAAQIERKALEAKVQAAIKAKDALKPLRLIAGEGRTLNNISAGKSSNRARYARMLVKALRVAAEHFGEGG